MSFAKNLRYYRLKNNLSKKELAALAGISPVSVARYENGQRKPSMAVIKALSEALHIRVSDFLAVRYDENLTFVHGKFH